jgi:hypothetical protein
LSLPLLSRYFSRQDGGLACQRPFSSGAFRLDVRTLDVRTEDKRNLTPWNARVPGTTEWREVRWGFNSLWYDKVKISIGSPNARAGKAWIDSVRVEGRAPQRPAPCRDFYHRPQRLRQPGV